MSNNIARRIAALERVARGTVTASVVIIRGGLSDGDPTFAVAGGGAPQWHRGAEEAYDAFTARVVASATAEGAASVVFGGLPN